MIDVAEICKNFMQELDEPITKKDVLNRCVQSKLLSLYEVQSEEFDILLDEVMNSIDFDNVARTKNAIKRLSKNLSSSREHLITVIEGLVK